MNPRSGSSRIASGFSGRAAGTPDPRGIDGAPQRRTLRKAQRAANSVLPLPVERSPVSLLGIRRGVSCRLGCAALRRCRRRLCPSQRRIRWRGRQEKRSVPRSVATHPAQRGPKRGEAEVIGSEDFRPGIADTGRRPGHAVQDAPFPGTDNPAGTSRGSCPGDAAAAWPNRKMRDRPGPAAVHGQEHRERNRTHRVGFLSRAGMVFGADSGGHRDFITVRPDDPPHTAVDGKPSLDRGATRPLGRENFTHVPAVGYVSTLLPDRSSWDVHAIHLIPGTSTRASGLVSWNRTKTPKAPAASAAGPAGTGFTAPIGRPSGRGHLFRQPQDSVQLSWPVRNELLCISHP
jgi:hypothetical protein